MRIEKKVMQMMTRTAALGAVMLWSSSALAAGFQINEHSAINTGKASSVVATVKDPSAIWHNPAGLTQTEGTEFSLGVTLISPQASYTGEGLASTNPGGGVVTQEASSSFVPVPNAYISRALSSKAYVGFGFYAPYGLGIKWTDPENFVGRTVVQELSLRTFFMTPTIALKLTEEVSVAVGVSLVPATVYLKRTLGTTDGGQVLFPTPQYSQEGTVEVAGTAFGIGATGGVQVSLIDHLKLGFAFRSAVDLSFSGDAKFDVPDEAPTSIRANFPDQGGSAEVTLPHTFLLGIGWVQDNFTIEASGQLTLWGSYDELRLNFDEGRPTPSSASPRNWKAVPLLRLGAQLDVSKLALRAGAAYDITPAPDETVDPTLPDGNRIIMTLGAGYEIIDALRFDVSYMLLLKEGRTLDEPNLNFAAGTYDSGTIHLISLSAGVRI